MTPNPSPQLKTAPAARSAIRLPMWKLAACMLAAPKLALIGAGLIAIAVGGEDRRDRLVSGFWLAVALYAGVALSVGFLWCFRPRPAPSWIPVTITAQAIRLALTTAAAAWIFLAVDPDKSFFWTEYAAASLLILGVEIAVLRPALRASSALRLASPPDRSESRAA